MRRREGWVWAFAAATVLGILLRQPALVVVSLLLSAAGLGALYWGRHALDRLTYERELSTRRAFQGDTVGLTLRLTNRKLLPLPYVEVVDLLPDVFATSELALGASGIERTGRLQLATSLGWYEQAEWRYQVPCPRRGVYRLGPATLRSADLFGFFPVTRTDPVDAGLLVYPRLRTLAELGMEQTMPFGGNAGGDPLFTDPMRIKGTRDYAPGDPLRQVDWKATARAQRMQTRLLEPAAAPQVLVFLDVDTFELTWEGTDPEALEDAVSVAASLAYASAEGRFAVGLFSNGTLPEVDAAVRLRPSTHPDQVLEMLGLLARVTPISRGTIGDLLLQELARIPARTFVFVVTAVPRSGLVQAASQLRSAGVQASLVYVGREPLPPAVAEARWHGVYPIHGSDGEREGYALAGAPA